MANDKRMMYDEFSDKSAHSVEWFEFTKNFLKLAFASDHREVKCPCNRCQNRWMLFKYKMSGHIAKQGFMPNYLVWHQHRGVQAPAADESDGINGED
jgi:hypothetical protein